MFWAWYGIWRWDLPRRTASNKLSCLNPFEVVVNQKYDGYQSRFVSMIYIFFDKKAADTGTHTGTGTWIFENQELLTNYINLSI